MIKSEVIGGADSAPDYPQLMVDKIGTVVLFKAASIGVVVAKGTSTHYPIGYYSTDWDDVKFKLFNGTITLENG